MSDTSQEIRDRARGEQLLESVKAGTALHPDSPGGKSLLASYRRWQDAEQARHSDASSLAELREGLEAVKAMLQPLTETISKTLASPVVSTPKVVEESAQRRSEAAVKAALLDGTAVGAALTKGYASYKQGGGRSTEAVWRKSLR
jgi:rhodanese-related sulfurtransferase